MPQIDVLKALAILAVILIHSAPEAVLYRTGAAFHYWQAVALFIILGGLNSAGSMMRHRHATLRQCYIASSMLPKILRRLLAPYLVVVAIEVLIKLAEGRMPSPGGAAKQWLITGGVGPGAYFIPVFIQHLLVVPLLFVPMIRWPAHRGTVLAFVFVVALVLEYACAAAGVPEPYFRMLYVRYLFAGALGVYLAVSRRVNVAALVVGALLGAAYIFAETYLTAETSLIYGSNPRYSQHTPSFGYTLALVVLGLLLLPRSQRGPMALLTEIGRASFHIYLVQKLYFYAFRHGLGPFGVPNDLSALPVNIVVCVLVGWVFFRLDSLIGRRRLSAGDASGTSA